MDKLKILVILVLACGIASGQARLTPARRVRVRVQVRFASDNAAVGKYAEVELTDPLGNMDRKLTDAEGLAEFTTLTGSQRVRITRDDLQPREIEFDIMPNEVNHVEHIRVLRKTEGAAPPVGTGDTVSASSLKVPRNAEKQLNRGLKALDKRQWSEAKASFESAIALYDRYDAAYNGLGVALISMNNTSGARQAFARAVELNPSYAEALRNLARINVGEGKYADAAPLLDKSLSVEPLNMWAMVTLAYVDLKTGNYTEAATLALKVHGLPGEDATAHFIAGCALEALARKEEALRQFETYLREDPQGANAGTARESLARLAAAQE